MPDLACKPLPKHLESFPELVSYPQRAQGNQAE